MEIQIEPPPPGQETHIRIEIFYRGAAGDPAFGCRTEVGFSGVRPDGYDNRVTCGLLFIALGCFELVEGISEEPIEEGYTDRIVVMTETRRIYATSVVQARDVISGVIAFHARDIGLPGERMTESMIARLVGEAVEVLNGATETKINASGGSA